MNHRRRVVLLTDYKGEYFPRRKRSSITTDLNRLTRRFAEAGLELDIRRFAELRLRDESFAEVPVLYQSSQDPGLHYKSYLEDLLLALELQGARLIPAFHLFRAHHNKVLMELLRDLSPLEEMKTLNARTFGTFEDFDAVADDLRYPAVLKIADGDSSRGVALAQSPKEARRIARKLSFSFAAKDVFDNVTRRITDPAIRPASLYRRKFLVQDFVPGLQHDYKTLVFGDRLFTARRSARKDDFRASGSGRTLKFPDPPPAGMLDLAEKIAESAPSPFASIDILDDGERLHVSEVQFVRFGVVIVAMAPFCWSRTEGGWTKVAGPFSLEDEIARSVLRFLERSIASRRLGRR
ncbi:MAG: RimK family alpha-L-glutamate ligase [Myxococcota bacterium]